MSTKVKDYWNVSTLLISYRFLRKCRVFVGRVVIQQFDIGFGEIILSWSILHICMYSFVEFLFSSILTFMLLDWIVICLQSSFVSNERFLTLKIVYKRYKMVLNSVI